MLLAYLALAARCPEPATERAQQSDAPSTPVEAEPPSAHHKLSGKASVVDPVSPHWPHIRTMMSDYRIGYQSDAAQRAREYDWAARHFDRVILDYRDTRSAAEYRRRNPRGELFRYSLNWTVVQPGEESADLAVNYYDHMRRWFARHAQYPLEEAFLHDARQCPAGAPLRAECRVAVRIWTQRRWVLDPGDPGARAYQRARLAELSAGSDGVFLDEHGSGDIAARLKPLQLREYPDLDRYRDDLIALLAHVRAGIGPDRRLLLNTSEFISEWDRAMTRAAGGTHGEALNNPFHRELESRWRFLEELLEAGALVDLSPGGKSPESYVAGNSASAYERRKLWELASYHLLVPETPDGFALNLGMKWDQPYASRWIEAVAVNLGSPLGNRHIYREGRAPTGRSYRIWRRDFERAVVLVRTDPEGGYLYDDRSAVRVDVKSDHPLHPLRADGSWGVPVTSLPLRAAEAAILMRPDARAR